MLYGIILAGGKGSSAFPFATVRNKVTLPVLGKPIILVLVDCLFNSSVEQLVIVTNYHEQSVKHVLKGFEHRIRYLHNPEGNDIASAIRSAIRLLSPQGEDNLIILHGDIVTSENAIKQFIKTHCATGEEVSILYSDSHPRPIHSVGLTITNDQRLDGFCYEPNESPFWFCNAMIGRVGTISRAFDLEAGIPRHVPLGAMPHNEGSLVSALELMLDENVCIRTERVTDFLVDVDHPWDWFEANRLMLEQFFKTTESQVQIDPTAVISDGADIPDNAKVLVGKHVRIGKGCVIRGNLIIEDGSQIDSGAIVGSDVWIGSQTTIAEYAKVHSHSIIGPENLLLHATEFYGMTLDTVYMVHQCCISAVIGSHVDIGAGAISATWRFDNRTAEQVCKEHKEIPPYYGNLTYIGDFTRIGVNALFMPGVRVGAYSCVGPNVVVYTDIPNNSMVLLKQQLEQRTWGPDKYP